MSVRRRRDLRACYLYNVQPTLEVMTEHRHDSAKMSYYEYAIQTLALNFIHRDNVNIPG